MKTNYLICMLMIVLMLCGCTAMLSDAAPEGAEPGFPSVNDPPVNAAHGSTAQEGTDASRTDGSARPGPTPPGDERDGRALNEEELQALWARLEGKWILSDLQAWKQSDGFAYSVYEFSPMEHGGCRLLEYSALGSGAYKWDWTVVREQNGVYKIRVASESGEMTQYICHQNSGALFTLQFTEDGILLAWSRPTRYEYWETQPTEEMGAITGTRLATEEECERLANEGDEYGQLWLEKGCAIIAGHEHPAQEYRLITDEELEQLRQKALG